jgi:ribonucleoside-diphosphate reductase alpha chain
MRERSVGLGVMGFHSFLQQNNIPLESVMAKVWNKKMFKHIRGQCDEASKTLAKERGACPDAADFGIEERFSNKLAIAPTASISIICGGASPGIEPSAANVYNHKTLSGSFVVRNPYLEKCSSRRAGTTRTPGPRSRQPGLGAASRLPRRPREGGVQDRVRDRPALAGRACRRPRALHLPEPVAQHLPAGRRAQARPAPDPHDGVEARREEPLLLPLALDPARRAVVRRRSPRRSATRPFTPKVDAPRPCRSARRRPQQSNDYEECLSCQ